MSVDYVTLCSLMQPYLPLEGFDPETWLEFEKNLALIDDKENLVLLEYNLPGVYTGHWFFKSRGKEAVQAAEAFLDKLFSDKYNVKIIRGLTPLQKLGARWLAKRVGFKPSGVTQTKTGPCELFIIHNTDREGK